jgi:glycosyltransferase involved in cell wall biosynthesis
MSKVLVISADTIPTQNHLAAGTGIRSWEIARGLTKYGHDITIAVPKKCYDSDLDEYLGVKIKTWDYDNLISLCDNIDAVFLPQGDSFLSNFFAEHIRNELCVIVDVYDPNLIESLNIFPQDASGIRGFSDYLMGIVPLLKRGDFFVCASNRQRYYYLGVLNVLGRINPLTYNEKLIEIVPFGVPDEDPVYEERNNVMRGSLVNNDDFVVLWFGGIYPWFDAITLIKAIDIAAKQNPKIKLIIMGAVHPRLHAPPDNYIKTLELSKELGLYNKNIFFTEWRPYNERIYWYNEADIGICTFPMHLETELSNRTRVVDMLWGGLPIVTTEGDELSTLIKQYNCGETVKPKDPEKLAEVLLDILGNNEKQKRMVENTKKLVNERLRWNKIIRPLAEFLNNSAIAKDRRDELAANTLLWYVDTLERNRAYIPTEKKLLFEIKRKEQQINQLNEVIQNKDKNIENFESRIADIYNSTTWRVLTKYQRFVDMILPLATKRRRIYDKGIMCFRNRK